MYFLLTLFTLSCTVSVPQTEGLLFPSYMDRLKLENPEQVIFNLL